MRRYVLGISAGVDAVDEQGFGIGLEEGNVRAGRAAEGP